MITDVPQRRKSNEDDALLLSIISGYCREYRLSEVSPLVQILLRNLRMTYQDGLTDEEEL